MATVTHAAPINIDQINTEFYVTPRLDGFSTIQKAVDYVRLHNGSTGRIIIEQGVDVADSIPNVTGGGYSILIWDNRAGSMQQWGWDGTKYVPYAFDQLAGYVARGAPGQYPGSTTMDYTALGGSGNGRGDINVIANPNKGMPAIALTCFPSDGTAGRTFFRGDQNPIDGSMRVQIPAGLFLTNPENLMNIWMGQPNDLTTSRGMSIWAKPSANAIDFQGETIPGIYNQTIRLNPLGGDVEIARGGITAVSELQTGDLNITGDTHQTGDLFLAGNATMGRLTAVEIAGSTISGTPGPLSILTDLIATANLNVTGDADIAGELQATAAAFDDCLVGGSPVRTFANSGGGGGAMEWPPEGIGVSTGTAWDTSIDPVTLAYLNQKNIFTGQMVIQSADPSKQLLEILNPSITKGTIKAFDIGKAEGVNQKFFCNFYYDGDSTTFNNYVEFVFWGVPTSMYLYPGGACIGPNFSKDATLHVSGTAHITDATSIDGILSTAPPAGNFNAQNVGGTQFTWNLQGGDGHSNFVNVKGGGGGGFSWYIAANGEALTSATVAKMLLDSAGGLSMTGGMAVKGNSNFIDGSTRLTYDNAGQTGYLDIFGTAAGQRAQLVFRQSTQGAGSLIESLHFDVNANAKFAGTVTSPSCLVRNAGQACTIEMYDTAATTDNHIWMQEMFAGNQLRWKLVNDAFSNDAVFFDVTRSGLAIQGITLTATSVNVVGAFSVTGAKSFVVTHPLDDTKDLYHSCLEGPENGVYYRGEAQIVDGYALVTLPDYFEALTFAEDRSVQLTQVYEGAPVFARMAASRIVNGQFTIQSTENVTVAWEVKAVRRIGVDRLEVTRSKVDAPTPTPQQESKHGQRKRPN